MSTDGWNGHVWKRLKLTATQWVQQVIAPNGMKRRRRKVRR